MNNKFKIILFPLFFLGLILISCKSVFAQVVINEFVPRSSQEWVEFYNKGTLTEDLSNYFFDDDSNFDSDDGSSGKFQLIGFLSPQGTCYWNINSFLNDGGDVPSIFFLDKNLIDSYTYTGSDLNRSYSRVPDGDGWQANQEPTKSLVECLGLAPTPTPTPTTTPIGIPTPTLIPQPTATPVPTSYDQILINEFLVDPESGNEKVEIKNNNDYTVKLVNWRIDDKADEGHLPTDPFSVDISPGGYYTYELASGFLNNDGDEVRLLDFTGTQKSQKSYSSSTKGLSWQRDPSGNWCEQDSSFNTENSDCPTSTSTPIPSSIPLPSPTPKPTNTPTLKPTPTLTEDELLVTRSSVLEEAVLGTESAEGDSLPKSLSEESQISNTKSKNNNLLKFLPYLIITAGLGLIGFSVFSLLKSKGGLPKQTLV